MDGAYTLDIECAAHVTTARSEILLSARETEPEEVNGHERDRLLPSQHAHSEFREAERDRRR